MNRALKRFVRAVLASALAGALTAALSNIDALRDAVVDIVSGIPGLTVENERTVAMLVIALLSAGIQALDKHLRDKGLYS
jgi:hypothetical protein